MPQPKFTKMPANKEQNWQPSLLLPSILYGREQEKSQLHAAWQRVVGGASELVWVTGSAGVGKSSLIHSFQADALADQVCLTSKADQFKNTIPYSVFLAIFPAILQADLGEDKEKSRQHRQRLALVLGEDAGSITPIIPELQEFITIPPCSQQNAPEDADSKIHLLLLKFIACLSEDHPLILILDDLQWADAASCRFLAALASAPDLRQILIIASYRDSEITEHHPLSKIFTLLSQEKLPAAGLCITPLKKDDIGNLLADTLHYPPHEVRSLAEIIHHKTVGNPFYTINFIQLAHSLGFFHFDLASGLWQWSLDEIQALEMPQDVVIYLLNKIRSLPCHIQETIAIAACIGNQFNLGEIKAITDKKNKSTAILHTLVQEGLIIELPGQSFSFVHDRIQQAAYLLFDDEFRKRSHLRLAFWRLHLYEKKNEKKWLYEICDQFLQADSLLDTTDNPLDIVRLFLTAGKNAYAANALDIALCYLKRGISLMHANPWQNQYKLIFELCLTKAGCEYGSGQFSQADISYNEILANRPKPADKARVCAAMVELYEHQGRPEQAVKWGTHGLKNLGITNRLPLKIRSIINLIHLRFALNPKKLADIINITPGVPDDIKLRLRLYVSMIPPAYYTNQELMFLLVSEATLTSLDHGVTNDSLYAFAALAGIEGAVFGRYKFGRQLGDIALQLTEKMKNRGIGYTVKFIYGAMISHWTRPMAQSLPILEKAYTEGYNAGNMTYTSYAACAICAIQFFQGTPLDEVAQTLENYAPLHKKIKFKEVEGEHSAVKQAIILLQGKSESIKSFSNSQYNETTELQAMLTNSMQTPLYWYYVFKLQCLTLFGYYEEACTLAKTSDSQVYQELLGMFHVAQHCFFYALAATGMARKKTGRQRRCYRNIIVQQLRRLKKWSSFCPENFSHKYLLISAELSSLNGNLSTAMSQYNEAISLARQNGFIQDTALGYELLGCACQEHNLSEITPYAISESFALYKTWGATAKCRQLRQNFAKLLPNIPRTDPEKKKSAVLNPGFSHNLAQQEAHFFEKSQLYTSVAKLNNDLSQKIAARQQMEEHFQASERRYQLLAENVSDVIWTLDLYLRPTFISPSILNLRGYSVSEAMAQTIDESLTEESRSLAFSIFGEELEKEKLPDIDKNRSRTLELEFCCKDGSTVWTESKISFLYDRNEKLNGFLGITRDISTRRKIQSEIARSRTKFRELSTHLQTIREEEKSRIARDVHDELGQSLTALDMDISWLANHFISNKPEIIEKKLQSMSEIVDNTITSIQRICTELRPAILDHCGLGAAIEWQIGEFERRSGINCRLTGQPEAVTLKGDKATALFRIFQEALTNVVRHAKANAVEIFIDIQGKKIILEIRDNGIGINKEMTNASGSFGLLGMQERAKSFNGQVQVEPLGDGGTLVRVIL